MSKATAVQTSGTTQEEQKIPYLTKTMRDAVQTFFNNFELCSIHIANFEKSGLCQNNPGDTVADLAKFLIKIKNHDNVVPIKLGFVQKEKPSDSSFTKGENEWKMKDEDNDIRLWKWPEFEWFMNLKTKISPSEFNVPGFYQYLEDRYTPPIRKGRGRL